MFVIKYYNKVKILFLCIEYCMQKTLSVVNLQAIKSNVQLIKTLLNGQKFYAVIKANAYGHGAEQVALYIQDCVDGFCVAIAEEGAALRIAGVSKPILVFTPPLDGYDCERYKFYNLTATVNSVYTAKLISGLNCHVKVNTGMNRLGCSVKDLPQVLSYINNKNLKGVYSHLYAPQDKRASEKQLKIFNQTEEYAKSVNPNCEFHLAASGGILLGGSYLKNAVRCGILLYGYPPEGFKLKGLQPALKVYARHVQKTEFIGGGAGYQKAKKNYRKLNCYRLGYADGFSRTVPLGENYLCMDAFVSEKNEKLLPVFYSAANYAEKCKTISYEVLCKATMRSEIIYER